MHLLALGAFWRAISKGKAGEKLVVMHLLALGAFWLKRRHGGGVTPTCRNAPSGARCFLALEDSLGERAHNIVVMHLLALGAFWPWVLAAETTRVGS